ncbi:PPOX class F420-dependent oxidoreductase [Actinokineospora fastidiosa]|uniref:PPOX class F420-dependent oxidoreductase n=1 Tax=Actinokineospora fastidiosa TaxID=1816 RepID=A0A918GHC8_9PSEU|nr:PPOX class F420-dependent oxidoreductase [Actinokineospora fastidiosa]GGS37930.1 PPOX class F420-dependent oxidoreductase [Actinokineospora fastidiosa]
MTPLARLGAGKYVLVTTYRRDGRAVPTPVWVVRDDDELLIWTVTDSGKVKRIRNNPRVELAECDFRGRPTGESVPATARLLDADETERTRRLMRRKYGITGTLTILGSKLRRGARGTIGVALTLD